jgi:hypothetical protein
VEYFFKKIFKSSLQGKKKPLAGMKQGAFKSLLKSERSSHRRPCRWLDSQILPVDTGCILSKTGFAGYEMIPFTATHPILEQYTAIIHICCHFAQ